MAIGVDLDQVNLLEVAALPTIASAHYIGDGPELGTGARPKRC
jgi:hypothetical protein